MQTKFIHLAIFLLLLCTTLVTGCSKTTVILLPDPDGKVGNVTVTSEAGSIELTKSESQSIVQGKQSLPSAPKVIPKKRIQQRYADVLTILPDQPKHFLVYFKSDSTLLTEASKDEFHKITDYIDKLKSQSISVVGHTDTAGNTDYNIQLSQRRAKAVQRLLVSHGIKPEYITTTSHGENNLLVKTADNVHERRNRRVEVIVR